MRACVSLAEERHGLLCAKPESQRCPASCGNISPTASREPSSGPRWEGGAMCSCRGGGGAVGGRVGEQAASSGQRQTGPSAWGP